MAYWKHIDKAKSYCNRERAEKVAENACRAENVRWFIASNSQGKYVPVAWLDQTNEHLALALVNAGMYTIR